ncbi:MAG: hypothetical protein A2Z69_02370 [Bacteroidetes bacterium RBG_13_44_24]|nr:MAG: hypothetical protein A2Z69_02370 [Bacteroidetes bacterium RBG_13_44_24]
MAQSNKVKPIKVVEDNNSPTGYTVICGTGHGVPATNFEIRLWLMYNQAMETVRKLESTLNDAVNLRLKDEKESDE